MLGQEGWFMRNDLPTGYLAVLPEAQRAALARTNRPGLEALRDYLDSRDVVAFLGREYRHRCTRCGRNS
jgi:hypothetical protein